MAHATLTDPASYIPPSKYPVLNRALLDACDMLDGVNDGVLEEPTRCRFDPKELECEGADGPGLRARRHANWTRHVEDVFSGVEG